MPTQPLIWWKPRRKEGKTTGPTGQVKDEEERSSDHNTVREGEPSSDETNQPADEKGTIADIITTLSCIGVTEPGSTLIPKHPPTTGCVWSEDRDLCITHNCITKRLKMTSKKWTWLKKKDCYGWSSRKVERIVCTHRMQASRDQDLNVHCSDISDSGLGVVDRVGGDEESGEVGGFLFTRQLSDRDRREGGL